MKTATKKVDPEKPSLSLLVMLGSALVHFDEGTSPEGVDVDLQQARILLKMPEVVEWFKKMGALLPVKRSAR